jgi:hypothetical protein
MRASSTNVRPVAARKNQRGSYKKRVTPTSQGEEELLAEIEQL